MCAIAVAAGGCGTTDEAFTSGEADRALAALDSVQELVDDGRCKAAQRRVQVLITQSSNINSDRPEIGAAYAKSAERLQELVSRECVEIKETTPTDATSSTGDTGPTEAPEPTNTPTPPEPEPTGGGTPVQPDNPGNDNGNNGGGNDNPSPDNSGGARPQ